MTYTERLHKLIFEEPFFNYAIFCDTKEKAEIVVKSLYELGFAWGPNVPLYKEDGTVLSRFEGKRASKGICYSLNENSTTIFCSRKEFYEKKLREILTFDELFKDCVNNIDQTNENESQSTSEQKTSNEFKETIEDNPMVNMESMMSNTEDNKKTSKPDQMNSEISVTTEPLENNKHFCWNCGKTIKEEAKFCVYCGSKQERPQLPVIEKELDVTEHSKVDTSLTKEQSAEKLDTPKQVLNENQSLKEEKQIPKEEQVLDSNTSEDKYNLFELLGVRVNQPFSFGHQTYRFNEKCLRERCITQNIWVLCNDEMELIYMINHPDSIKVI